MKSKLKGESMEQKYKQARGVNLAAGIVDIVIGGLRSLDLSTQLLSSQRLHRQFQANIFRFLL